MIVTRLAALAAFTCSCAIPSFAANDRFFKEAPGSLNGFEPAADTVYRKECGACHTPYLPGLLPARSWELQMSRLDKHFGESVTLPAATHARISKYLVEHAADNSKFEGSRAIMERVDSGKTPYRLGDLPTFREMHRVIQEVIDRRAKIKVRNTVNCQECHLAAEEGSFGTVELFVPGLTPANRRAGASRQAGSAPR